MRGSVLMAPSIYTDIQTYNNIPYGTTNQLVDLITRQCCNKNAVATVLITMYNKIDYILYTTVDDSPGIRRSLFLILFYLLEYKYRDDVY